MCTPKGWLNFSTSLVDAPGPVFGRQLLLQANPPPPPRVLAMIQRSDTVGIYGIK